MNRHRSAGRSAFLAVLMLAAALGCGGGTDDDFLDLTWVEFDQRSNTGWRPLADRGDYAGAARMIETYLDHRVDLLPAQLGYSRFHAGQLWAMNGDTERALTYIDQSTVTDMPPGFPQSFNALVTGTGNFMRGDMAAVRSARDEVAAMPDPTARDLEFLEALDLLANNEGLTYREIHALAVESGR